MPICSYLLTPRQGKLTTVQDSLAQLPGVEVYAADDRELLVVVTETADQVQEDDLNEKMNAIEGIDCLALSFGAMN
jgi:nitrate reductase NapAB chaperone NapD